MTPPRRSRNDSYQFGDWFIDPFQNHVQRGDEERQIEPETMDVLVCLLRHATEVVSTQELIREVWHGVGVGVEEGEVRQHVSEIRRALDDNAQNPKFVENIPPAGYRTVAHVQPVPAASGDVGLPTASGATTPPFPAYAGMEPYVFVCYAHADRAEVYREISNLRDAEINVWYDEGISPGSEWSDELATAINACQHFLFFASSSAVDSHNCRDEIQFAKSRQKSLLIVYLESLTLPAGLELSLGATQALHKHSMPDDDYVRKLLTALTPASSGTDGISVAPGALVTENRAVITQYLESVRDDHGFAEIRGMGAERVERLPLERVFTPLRVRIDTPNLQNESDFDSETERTAQSSSTWLRQAFAHHPHAVLIGDPGSGKTTFLRYMALLLARAGLGEKALLVSLGLARAPTIDDTREPNGKGDALPVEPDSDGAAALLPIYIRADDFGKYLQRHTNGELPDESPKHLFRYLDWLQEGMAEPLPDGFLSRRVQSGSCVILVDGLDEVAGEATRIQLAEIMSRVVRMGIKRNNRHLITCRTRAWQGHVQIQDQHIESLLLLPFAEDQIRSFVQRWVEALFKITEDTDSGASTPARRYYDQLLGAINARPETRILAANPLMLSVLAVVHWNRKHLPEQRAELYNAAVSYLIGSRETDLALTEYQRLEGLQALALAMFEHPDGVQRRVGRVEAAGILAQKLNTSVHEALTVLDSEALLSGVLVSRSEGEFEFWHLTFQEYLAACELYQDEERWPHIEDRLLDDRWREVLLLLAGCMRGRSGERAARRLIERILDNLPDQQTLENLTGRLILISHVREDLLTYGGDVTSGTRYAEDLHGLVDIFAPDGRTAGESVRIEIGRALGQVGDPRLGTDDGGRLEILSGRVRLEPHRLYKGIYSGATGWTQWDQDLPRPIQEVAVNAFTMARYKVTVQAFARFIDAGRNGYMDEAYWSPDGWKWRVDTNRTTPSQWLDQLRFPNQPVRHVTYFEGEAYCRWQGGTLPTEAQWMWAARGAGRKYPWGDSPPDSNRCVTDNEPAQPVGSYPEGCTPEGICDLSSNVNEWCVTRFNPFPENFDPEENDRNATVWRYWQTRYRHGRPYVVKGGPGAHGRHAGALDPYSEGPGLGFRVVWSAS